MIPSLLFWAWLFCLATIAAPSTRVLRHEDLLSPYGTGPWNNRATKSHRFVRSCFRETHGSAPFELHTASRKELMTYRRFQTSIGVGSATRTIQGNLARIGRGMKTVSVLEAGRKLEEEEVETSSNSSPTSPSGCAAGSRRPVSETASAADCAVATNAGFFDTRTGECHGHVVSDGTHVTSTTTSAPQNAHFGITKEGRIFTGYLADNSSLAFQQLVGGVVWLVRRGKSFVDESKKFECEDTQETGSLKRFVSVTSARTAIGHDDAGNVLLAQVDGKTGERGVNLYEFSELLISFGFFNAINLDGGGSATFVVNGTTVNFPSDLCSFEENGDKADPWNSMKWSCDRRVTTVICFHNETCPNDCSSAGVCQKGLCRCFAGRGGPDCGAGCIDGRFGADCADRCRCHSTNSVKACDKKDGKCRCRPGFTGIYCEEMCPYGFFGDECSLPCVCGTGCPCDHISGDCLWKNYENHKDIFRSRQDVLLKKSNLSQYYLTLNKAANCKISSTISFLNLEIADSSSYNMLLWIVSGVLSLSVISILVNCCLLCWSLRLKRNLQKRNRFDKNTEEIKSSPNYEKRRLMSRPKHTFQKRKNGGRKELTNLRYATTKNTSDEENSPDV